MEAIVLAGGFGTRLKQVVQDVPKPMAPINGHPFLEILLTSLASKGFKRVVLSLGHMADKISNHFGNHFSDLELIYEIETTPLETGGAIRAALPHCKNDHAFIFNGDTYLDLEAIEVETLWQQTQQPIIVACKVDDSSRYGGLKIKNNHVIGFSEKGQSGKGLINAGCYLLPTHILDHVPLGQKFSLENQFLTQAVLNHPFQVFITQGQFIDIGIPEDYSRAQTLLAKVLE